jgi:hypothetical protein
MERRGLKILRQSATSRAANDKTSASFAARAWKNKSQPCGRKKNDTENFRLIASWGRY